MQTASKQPRAQRGVTLIEVGIALAVIAVIAGTVAPSFAQAANRRRVEGLAEQARTDLHYAATAAIARGEPLRISFVAITSGSGYVIHNGTPTQCGLASDGSAQCSGTVEVLKTLFAPASDAITLQANVSSMLFDPLHRTVSPSGTLKIVGSGNRAIHHVVNILGRVRSCSPQPALAGYKTC
jgi:type IV fimbrial biogenesis protein FimT